MLQRTSITSPLRIDSVAVPTGGSIGITICPGKKDMPRGWDRDLAADVAAIAEWNAAAMVTLLEDHEFDLLGVRRLPYLVIEQGIAWFHVPIRDVSIPDFRFQDRWSGVGSRLMTLLNNGRKVLVHCRGGLGRAGMVAAMVLIEAGVRPLEAIQMVRQIRPGAIETIQQEAYVNGYRRMLARSS